MKWHHLIEVMKWSVRGTLQRRHTWHGFESQHIVLYYCVKACIVLLILAWMHPIWGEAIQRFQNSHLMPFDSSKEMLLVSSSLIKGVHCIHHLLRGQQWYLSSIARLLPCTRESNRKRNECITVMHCVRLICTHAWPGPAELSYTYISAFIYSTTFI
jgi:hypothetical protein